MNVTGQMFEFIWLGTGTSAIYSVRTINNVYSTLG
jgi:hypothetical protein